MTDEQIKHMVNRFLQWKLPADFAPDNGVTFNHANAHDPVGTNLLDANQAEQMVRFMADGLPNPTPTPNSPDRNELRESLRHTMTKEWMLSSNIWCADATGKKKETVKFPGQMFKVGPSEKMLDEVLAMFDTHIAALQQTIEAGLPGKLNMDDAMLNHGWADEEYVAWNKALRMCRSAITKAFEAAKAGKDSK